MQVEYGRSANRTGPKLARALAGVQSDEVLQWGTQCGNKRLQLLKLKENSVPTPQFFGLDDWLTCKVIGRPDYHSQGRKLWICENSTQAAEAIRKGATHFTQFIDAPHEFRVHVVFDKVIRMAQKMGGEGQIRNHRFGWHFNVPTIEEREPCRVVAKAAVKALGYDYGAVDVLFDGTHAWVLEVNMAPALDDSTLDRYVEHFKAHYEGN